MAAAREDCRPRYEVTREREEVRGMMKDEARETKETGGALWTAVSQTRAPGQLDGGDEKARGRGKGNTQ